MQQVILQGELSTSGTKIEMYPGSVVVSIVNFRVNNPSAYTLTVKRYDSRQNVITTLYEVDLSAGDTLVDEYPITLTGKDYLELTSDVVGTMYTVILFR